MCASKFDLDAARSDPSGAFSTPDEVVSASELTDGQKLEILRQWETDIRLMAVAEEENMPGLQPVPLDRILKAIESLEGPMERSKPRGGASSGKLGV